MPTVIAAGPYGPAPSYAGKVPTVEVILRPKYRGAEYRAVAVVDSGAELSYVPYGIPTAHGWTPKGVDQARINPMGGPTCKVNRYLVSLQLNAVEWSVPVCEQPKGSSVKCILLGQDVLRRLLVELDGPSARLQMTLP
ncbi:MAG: hypothetical protein HY560_02435 [Gemmatimonadetes bacterium]|nr:hypothetical protein [Gemmatimonadota bacterium]